MKLLTILAMFLAGSALANEIPKEALALQSTLYARLPTSVRIWINAEARHLCVNSEADDSTIRVHAQKRFTGQQMHAADMDALVFLTMTLAAQQTDRELQAENARAKAVANAQHLNQSPEPAPAPPPRPRSLYGQAMDRARTAGQPPPPPAPAAPSRDIDEEASARLQTMMERRSKFISAISNAMKKVSSTQDTLLQNLK